MAAAAPTPVISEGDPFFGYWVLDGLARVCHDASWVG
jgi:hypothetical protein